MACWFYPVAKAVSKSEANMAPNLPPRATESAMVLLRRGSVRFACILLLQSITPGRIIGRLFVMGGTIAQSSVGCQASLSGHPPVVSTRPTTLIK